ncbi:MAG: porin [Cyanobacteria bacterium P01_G01_bin.19]
MKLSVFLMCIAISFGGSPVLAQENAADPETYPRIGGNVLFRFAYDGAYDAEAPRTESNDLFFEMIASPEFKFTERFSLNAEIRLENASPPTEDRYFEDQTLFVRKLFVNYDVNDRLSLQAGKLTPKFAFASLVTPGMYGNSYNRELELIERIGFEAQYTFDVGTSGRHTLSASTFFDDTSFLSDSLDLGGRRGQNRLSNGGASNTESFESFTVTLEGRKISQLSGFTYRLAYIHQAAGEGEVADENGFLIAAMQSFQLGDRQFLNLIGEIAPLWNFEGTDDDIIYASAGVVYQAAPWTVTLSGTGRWRELANGSTFDDYSVQTAVGYDLGRGTTVEIAHEFSRDQNANSGKIGFRFIQVLDF